MKVKELLCDESKHCRNHMALDSNGERVAWSDPDACRWCLAGAVYKCYPGVNPGEISAIFDKITEEIAKVTDAFNTENGVMFTIFNDQADWATIREVIERVDI